VIERELRQHPEVRQCLVFGVDAADRTRNQTIVACLVVDGARSADRFKAHLGSVLPAWQVPREWWFIDSLQVNARGKISRAFWRDRFLRGGPTAH
jgi:long-chain acyl-CoA synthetase